MTLIIDPVHALADSLALALGDGLRAVESVTAAERDLELHPDELLVVIGPSIDVGEALRAVAVWQVDRPELGVVLLRRRVDVQLLTEALRAGVREVVVPDDLTAVVTAARRSLELSRLRAQSRRGPGRAEPSGRLVTVFSAKGGAGKTTISTNLAAALARDGARVCVLDLDLEFGDVAISMHLAPERTLLDVMPMAGQLDEQGLRSVITSGPVGLDALLAPPSPGEAGRIDPGVLPELIRVLRRMYDVIVVDTPPALSEPVLAAFDASDVTVLLATMDVPSLKNLRLALAAFDMLRHPSESRLVVLNRADAKVGLTRDDVERTLGARVDVEVPSSGDVPASLNRGELLVAQRPEHPFSVAVRSLASAVRAHDRPDPGVPAPRTPRRGLRALVGRGGAR
ncbi:CpaE family protein [Spongisporangium articulatum]|uniref:CpaE family protein n=1 Tax=Spongisporangium articulatum TaxID=3362603 RepID=A0ABW8AIA1_9ACTN